MIYNFFAFFLILSFFSNCYQSDHWIDFRDLKYDDVKQDNLSSHCTKTGLQCMGCDTIILCRKEEGEYIASIYDNCTSTETCDEGECILTPNIYCSKGEYKCQSVEGMYPDPTSCKLFHYCVKQDPDENSETESFQELKLYNSECRDNFAYNPLTTYCDKELPPDGICPPSRIPKCIQDGQTGALEENPSIYYVCKPINTKSVLTKTRALYPYLDACDHGELYNAETYSCISQES
ncbi:hypothetical protein FQR65_LT13258 [Abscondita terminalis]|nr:hypothetical protein FQR65_LT13258 [Abscondita terminalis]